MTVTGTKAEVPIRFLSGGGEMGALMRSHDWTNSSLGPPATWPQSLRTVVRLILNTGHPMFVFAGTDGACLYNDAYRESIGPERHPGCLGRPAREVWDEIWDIIGPQIEQVMAGRGATWHVNHLVPITRHGKREEVYWTYSYSPIDDETAPNGIGGVLVVCSETTQQVLAARRLASERDELAQLFQQAPTFMVMLRGSEHRIELVNPGYVQLVGQRPLLGRTLAEALPDAVEQGYVTLLDQVYASGQAYTAHGAKYAMQAVAGGPVTERFVDFVYQPIRDDTGAVSGIFVVGADVTDRALADAALRDTTARFREMAEKLSDANRLKDEFLATLAHELRNPLAPIRNAVELMGLAPGDASVAHASREVIARQLGQMVRLIDDLLDLSRVSRGIVELRRSPVALAEVLRDAIETSRPLIESAGHALTVNWPADAFVIEADRTRMVQVFANLLNNAAKFTPRSGHIELIVERGEGGDAIVVIRDSGVGIAAPMLERVFDMFTQDDKSHAQISGGLGIGLTLVRRLAEMHGGTVEARSDGPGQGSEFRVRLPTTHAVAGVDARDSDVAAPRQPATRGRRIIVADDNVDSAESLSMMLRMVGHEAQTAHDGEQALALARDSRPEVMVLDIGMPGLGGHELARSIRAEPWGPDILLIAASGWGQAEDKRRSLDAGFDHHLVKPIELDVLLQILDENPGA